MTHAEIYRRCPPTKGDVLYIKDGATTGIAVVNPLDEPFSMLSSVALLRPHSGLMSGEFLCNFLNSPDTFAQMTGDMTGSAVRRLTLSIIGRQSIPVPPLPEQRRIVAKIDSLTGTSRRTRDHLDHIPRLVEKYKQAVLAAAFGGDLTREWRRLNGDVKWHKTTLGEVVTIASGQTPKGIEERLSPAGELPWFKVSSMNEPDNLLGLQTSQFRLSRKDARSLGLRTVTAGSITFPKRGGAIATNKKRRLLVEGALDLNLMVLTANGVSPDFLWWWMQKLDLASISNGSNVPQINNGDVSPLEIEVPPPVEQAEIARLVETAINWIDRLASQATSARKLIDRLDQAVLAKAFRGELVPQDPADEPASVLLKRIKAERGAMRKATRSPRAKSDL